MSVSFLVCYRILRRIALGLILVGLVGCQTTRPYTLGPVKTEDPDDRPVPRPEETEESMYWDRVDMSVFHQLEKPLNLNWTGRGVGRLLGVAGPDEADNVNVMDEPPNSSWWSRRHFYEEMSPRELARGPNVHDTTGVAAGPSQNGRWTVTSGKFQGASRGFQIQDAEGDRYLIKLDGPNWPELSSAAEVISTKILHASGYNVPQNTVTYFTPQQLQIAEDAMVREGTERRPMTREDLNLILAPYQPGPDGRIRGVASKFVEGEPLGPIYFHGTRDGDPNDRVRHEQRRELRGLRVISAWLNDADRRHANSLAVYTDERYVKHYLIDMGSTLGANAGGVHKPIHGQAYIIDQRKILQSLLALGAYRFPWWSYDPSAPYPAVGYFRADVFTPDEWVPSYPNPAFEKMTQRDAFWGAKTVMSFSDEDLKAIVETGHISNPDAEEYLLRVLEERRDKVGRYWFNTINPLDRFSVAGGSTTVAGSSGEVDGFSLEFDDLAVTTGLDSAASRTYRYHFFVDGEPLGAAGTTSTTRISLALGGSPLPTVLDERSRHERHARVVRVDLRTVREEKTSRRTSVYVHLPRGSIPRVVGIERH